MPVIIKWYGDRFASQIGADADRALREAGDLYIDALKEVVGVPGLGSPSDPGEPPRLQSGALHDSFSQDVSGGVLTVGSSAAHAGYLTDGTRTMAPRPFAGPARLRMRAAPEPAPEASRSPGVRPVWRQLLAAVVGVFRRA